MSIAISASLAYDHIMNFPDSFKNHIMPDQIHILNVCFMVDKLERTWGGTAANIAFNMKMLGGEPLIISALGKDGSDYLDYFQKLGLNTKYIRQDKSQLTASAYITTDADDNQITAFFNGPLGLAQEVELAAVKKDVKLALISPTHKDFHKLDKNWVQNYNWKIEPTTGPYILSSFKYGQFIIFEKNKNWWAKDLKYRKNAFNFPDIKSLRF